MSQDCGQFPLALHPNLGLSLISLVVVIISIAFAMIAITAAAFFLLSLSLRVRRTSRPDTESVPHTRRRLPYVPGWKSTCSDASDSETSIQISPSHPTIFGYREEKGEVQVTITPPTPAKRRCMSDSEEDLCTFYCHLILNRFTQCNIDQNIYWYFKMERWR